MKNKCIFNKCPIPAKCKKKILLLLVLIIVGQVIFAFISKDFTTPKWENKIYATIGVNHDNSDLHKLNEAGHYFGQTIIGWTKFPSFMRKLSKFTELPEGSSINAHMQERQNIIFTISTPQLLDGKKLIAGHTYIQSILDEYNSINKTKFVLSNVDYQQSEIRRTYLSGVLMALFTSLVIGLGILFIKEEFFK
jgi:hypothetical protein